MKQSPSRSLAVYSRVEVLDMSDEQQQAATGGEGGLPLAGRIALVTGSSRGLGQATALRLARLGADIVVNYRGDEQGAGETRAQVEALGQRAVSLRADVSNEDDVSELFKRAESELGAVAILVNNAGTTNDRLMLQMKLEDFESVLRTNLTSAFLCT